MKKLFFIAIAICICGSSCSKKNEPEQPQNLHTPTSPSSPIIAHRDGEDEDHPIVKGIARDIAGEPIDGVLYQYSNGTDTVRGVTADSKGCTVTLTGFGQWALSITKNNYNGIYKTVNIQDSFTTLIDTLQ